MGYNIFGQQGGQSGDIFTADTSLDAYKAVTFLTNGNVAYASSNNINHHDKVIGVTLNSGTTVTVQSKGIVDNPSWNWTPNQIVYLGLNGNLTSDPFSGSIVQQIGVAETATKIFVKIPAGIRRA